MERMMDFPERIWLDFRTANKRDLAYDEPPIKDDDDCSDEYARADILAATLAANAALVKRLDEARGAVIDAYLEGFGHALVECGVVKNAGGIDAAIERGAKSWLGPCKARAFLAGGAA
jgi:hypothetical protein